ncbi:MAG TPA: MFS transporter, partial [Burkholderiaceae bacterium]
MTASHSIPAQTANRQARNAAATLGLCLPGDTVLYLLLPLYAAGFGLSLPEVGVLLAANRLVRIAGYGWISRLHARHGPRWLCCAAVLGSVACALGYAALSGFWALLPLRLLWGLCYGAMNLALQALATSQADGAARRSGRAQALVAAGPMLALPLGAALALHWGPRPIFGVLAGAALLALPLARRLPHRRSGPPPSEPTRRLRRPGSLDVWSFVEGLTLDGLFIIG